MSRAEHVDHLQAFGVVHRHRLFDQARFACGRSLEGELEMTRWRSRDVDGVDLRVANQILGTIVYARHVVPARVVFCLCRGRGA